MTAEFTDAGAPAAWPVLDVKERRLLGVLVEKAKTTPDVYPMSVNALMTGANQKSNRDPILNLTEEDVDETLLELQKRGLVTQVQGGRVVRLAAQSVRSMDQLEGGHGRDYRAAAAWAADRGGTAWPSQPHGADRGPRHCRTLQPLAERRIGRVSWDRRGGAAR